MLLTPHTAVGVALGLSIPSPVIAVPLSFLMHFAGDLVPHWDIFSETSHEERHEGWRILAVMADLVVGVGIGLSSTLYVLWVLNEPFLALNVFLCGIASVLPDALCSYEAYTGKSWGPLKVLGRIQGKLQFQAPLPWGIISQIFVLLVSGLVIVSSIQ